MSVFNLGSLNIDRVYRTNHFVRPGETITSSSYAEFAGGKGLNQSIALARAGADVIHIGKIGQDGISLKNLLEQNNVNTQNIFVTDKPSGHAIIQVDDHGENAIVLYGGANQAITSNEIQLGLKSAQTGDWLLLQNETNRIKEAIHLGAERGLKIVFNPAPMEKEVSSLPFQDISWLIVNELEGEMISGEKTPKKIAQNILNRFPDISIVVTRGAKGVYFANNSNEFSLPAEKVPVIDTTGAGDTFIGFFIAELSDNKPVKDSLIIASKAAAACVSKPGAANSIPSRSSL